MPRDSSGGAIFNTYNSYIAMNCAGHIRTRLACATAQQQLAQPHSRTAPAATGSRQRREPDAHD